MNEELICLNQAIGDTRGGRNTKVHALVDGKARPVRLLLTAGNRHDIIGAPDLVAGQSDRAILADKAYDSDGFRSQLDELGLRACIPPKGGRVDPPSYHSGYYRKRRSVQKFEYNGIF